jgi:tRNA nucleotidyltransferase (CCA-adding enzyme)
MDLVTTHRHTDFDALASTMAATLLFPGAHAVLPKAVNPNVRAFLSIHKDVFSVFKPGEVDLARVRRLIVVDTNRWERLDGLEALQSRTDVEVHLWDHHPEIGDIQAQGGCQEETGATITLLLRLLKDQRKLMTPIQATLFLCGLYEDTGGLSFPSTRAEDAYAAGYLLERKADLAVVEKFLRPAYGARQKEVLFRMLQTAQRRKIKGHRVSISSIDLHGHVDSLAVVVRMYREILNVDAAFGVFHDRERRRCMLIGRSSSEDIDIGQLMSRMGGGGHPGAGSALIKGVNPEAVTNLIVELIEGAQRSSVQISDLMSFPVLSVTPETSMQEVAHILRSKGITGLPVISAGKLVGMISRRDFRKISKESQMSVPVKAFMATDVHTIDPGRSPTEAARLMVKHDIGRLPVVENEKVIGILTRSDTMLYFYDLLPD